MKKNLIKMEGLLIGAGALGQNLYSLCKKQGILISAVVEKKEAESIVPPPIKYNSIKHIPEKYEFNFIIICVEDRNIGSVVNELTTHFNDLTGKFCFHTSGALDSSILGKLKGIGAQTGSLHPLMTFNLQNIIPSVDNVPFAIEGDSESIKFLQEFSKILNAHPLIIPQEFKTIYHLLGVFSSNLYFGLLNSIHSIIEHLNENQIDISLPNLEPIINQTLKTATNQGISEKTISGPINRKDFQTMENHLKEIKTNFPEQLNIYKELSFVLARINNYSIDDIKRLKKIMEK